MEIKEYTGYCEEEILDLYTSVGWTAYTDQPELLRKGFGNSLLVLVACDGEKLLGLARTVGDGHTIVFVQDLLVRPEYQRQGIGSKLLGTVLERFGQVRQIELATDDRPESLAFYRSLDFVLLQEIGCCGLIRM